MPGSDTLTTRDPAKAADDAEQPRDDQPVRRTRRIVLIAALVLMLLVAGLIVYNVAAPERPRPPVPAATTTTLPPPTPAGEPIEVTGEGPLVEALPTVVLDHVLSAQEPDEEAYSQHQALEAWFLTYSAPGSDIHLHVLQWEDAEEALDFAADLVSNTEGFDDGAGEDEGRRSGDVVVEGETVGTYEISAVTGVEQPESPSTPAPSDAEPAATPEPLGPGLAVWTNGTVAMVSCGDAARLAQFYDNLPF